MATELEKLLHRPNIRPKAQYVYFMLICKVWMSILCVTVFRYYCVCCLNQFTIAGRDDALAAKLVEIYFTFFKVGCFDTHQTFAKFLISLQLYVDRGELDAKMLGALLTGVNRAFPFLKGNE